MNDLSEKESQTVEFKKTFGEEVIESLTAFANTKGGRVLVGVGNNGLPSKYFTVGEESIQQWLNEIKNKTQPSIIPNAEIIKYKDGKAVEFSVHEFPVKPVAFRGRYFKRVKNSNHQLSVSEISDVYLQSMQYSWDSYPYPKARVSDVDLDKVKKFAARVNSSGRFKLPENPQDALIKLRMLQDGVPTNAAMILFSKENLLYNVHIGRFKTPSMIIADKMISGSLFDVAEESMLTIIGHLKFAFEITGQTTRRTEIPEYPLDAVRELLLNALIHRDYKSSSDIQIKIFDKKITFYNPGGLFGAITEKDLLTDTYQASTRNKQIAEAFYLTHDIEKYGSGFVRIRQAISNYPTMKFDFHEFGDGFFTEFTYTEQKVSVKGENVTDRAENVTDNSGNVTDKTGNVTDKSENVTDKSENVTDKSGNVTDKTENVTDNSGNVTDKSGNVTDKAENVTDKSENVTDKTENVTDEEEDGRMIRILTLMTENGEITVSEIAGQMGVARRTILRDIEKLKNKNLLERVGPEKGGYWNVIKK